MDKPSSADRPPDITQLLLAAVAAAGGTTTASFAFANNHSPWQALGLVVLYGVLFGIFSLIIELLQKYKNKVLDNADPWLNSLWGRGVPGYRKLYYQHLLEQYWRFDVNGLITTGGSPLELERLYVRLFLVGAYSNSLSSNPVEPLGYSHIKR